MMRVSSMFAPDEDMAALLQHKRAEIKEKIKNGETEAKTAIGGNAYTESSWNRLVWRVDQNLEAVREEQKVRFEKMDAKREMEERAKRADAVKKQQEEADAKSLISSQSGYSSDVPYSYLAEDGVIIYNGVMFTCDEKNHAICLGDVVTNPKDVITVPLSEGGCLKVNRNNISQLSKAISMFSPEDIKRIMQAISLDAKIQQMKNEIDEDKNSLGDSADAAAAGNAGNAQNINADNGNDQAPTEAQISLLFQDRAEKEE